MKKYLIIFYFNLVSCHSSNFRVNKNLNYRTVNVENVNFFGSLKFDSVKNDSRYKLLFKDDKVKYLTKRGIGIFNNNEYYKVQFIKDSLTMLCRYTPGVYNLTEDTFLFYKNKCLWKAVSYNYKKNNKSIIKYDIIKKYYKFFIYDDYKLKILYIRINDLYNPSIIDLDLFISNNRINNQIAIDSTLTNHDNVNLSKLHFMDFL